MDHTIELASLEASEEVMERLAEGVRRRIGEGPKARRAALEVVAGRVAESIGVDAWEPASSTGAVQAVRELLDTIEGDLGEAFEEPHALGWLHQYFGEPEREASHRAHNEQEAKHETAGVTTQLYTPRWIADVLAGAALGPEEEALPSVLDPAVGGGQMLLAAYDRLRARRPDAEPLEIVGALSGRDIDTGAIDVARRTLKLRAARHAGERRPEVERRVDARIRPGDGLFEHCDEASVVLTNPPYMGARSMPEQLKERVSDRFRPFHRDLYAAFIRRCHELAESRIGVLAQQTIWYLKSFADARRALLERGNLELFVHFGPHAFASLGGEKANVAAFVQRAFGAESTPGAATFLDLRELTSRRAMRDELGRQLSSGDDPEDRRTDEDPEAFALLPGRPLAYWLPERLREQFGASRRLGDVADVPGCQNKTAANHEYVRSWEEIDADEAWLRPFAADVGEAPNRLEPAEDVRWLPYSKGGGYAPWWGNWQSFVDWSAEAREFYRRNSTSNLLPERYRFRQGICYTDFGGNTFNARWMPPGCLFDMAGPAIFPEPVDEGGPDLFALLGLLNTTPVRVLLNAMNPSIHYQVTDLRRLPLPEWSPERGVELAELARANVVELRALAAGLDESPVGETNDGSAIGRGDRSAESIAEECCRRERRLEQLAREIYGLSGARLDPVRSDHRYL